MPATGLAPWNLRPARLTGNPDRNRSRLRGRMSAHAGRAAEEVALRAYLRKGAHLLAERLRYPEGELDLVLMHGTVLVFVEVKLRKSLEGWDSPISAHQWHRLEAAASQYIVVHQADTGIQPICRFDVALVSHDGAVQIIENVWSCLT